MNRKSARKTNGHFLLHFRTNLKKKQIKDVNDHNEFCEKNEVKA